jgi:predicted lipase
LFLSTYFIYVKLNKISMSYSTNNTKYDWDDLNAFATIASKSYDIKNNIDYFKNIEKNLKIQALSKNMIEDKNQKKIIYYKNNITDAELYSFKYNKTLVLVFTGTNSKTDWKYNMEFSMEKIFIGGKFCRIHKGFYEQYYSLKQTILNIFKEYVSQINKDNLNVLIIAHSMGSIGKIAGINIREINRDINIDCVTFGSPKIGDQAFIELCDSCIDLNINVINDNDIVPILPISIAYKHSGIILVLLDNSVKYRNRNFLKELQIFSLFFVNWMSCLKVDVISDHWMSSYIKETKKRIINTK